MRRDKDSQRPISEKIDVADGGTGSAGRGSWSDVCERELFGCQGLAGVRLFPALLLSVVLPMLNLGLQF